jgi:hypothetical protein
MFEAARGDRKSIPSGIFSAQNAMGFPNTLTPIPFTER